MTRKPVYIVSALVAVVLGGAWFLSKTALIPSLDHPKTLETQELKVSYPANWNDTVTQNSIGWKKHRLGPIVGGSNIEITEVGTGSALSEITPRFDLMKSLSTDAQEKPMKRWGNTKVSGRTLSGKSAGAPFQLSCFATRGGIDGMCPFFSEFRLGFEDYLSLGFELIEKSFVPRSGWKEWQPPVEQAQQPIPNNGAAALLSEADAAKVLGMAIDKHSFNSDQTTGLVSQVQFYARSDELSPPYISLSIIDPRGKADVFWKGFSKNYEGTKVEGVGEAALQCTLMHAEFLPQHVERTVPCQHLMVLKKPVILQVFVSDGDDENRKAELEIAKLAVTQIDNGALKSHAALDPRKQKTAK
jgi:hypothetical protein